MKATPIIEGSRRQLTLFVPPDVSAPIEHIRQLVDPVQYALIAAHVTLCRDEELAIESISALIARLGEITLQPLTLEFGPPQRFSDHGALLPCTSGSHAFHQLRTLVLGTPTVRDLSAHITLAHPRNPRASANVEASFAALLAPLSIRFVDLCLIEQSAGGPWTVRHRFTLGSSNVREILPTSAIL